MCGYLIDTNVLSEIRKGAARAQPEVYQWWLGMQNERIFLSVMTLGEIRKGINRLRIRDAAQTLTLERWLDKIRQTFSGNLIEIGPEIAEIWGQIQAIRVVPDIDALLAASAIQHGLILVTRNEHDFKGLGVQVLNPFNT